MSTASIGQNIVQLIQAQGEQAARAREATGAIWGGALRDTGNAIASAIRPNPELQLAQQKVAEGQRQATDLKALDTAFSQPGGRDQILASVPGHLRPQISASFTAADESAAKLQSAQIDAEKASSDYVTTLAEHVKAHDYDPTAMQLALSHAKQTFASNPSILGQLGPMEAALQANPTADTVKGVIDPIIKAHDAQATPVKLAGAARPGGAPETLVNPATGEVKATGASAGPAPITNEVELTNDANNPQSPTAARSKMSLDMLAAAKSANASGELKFGRVDGAGPVIAAVFDPRSKKIVVNGESMDPSRFQAPIDPNERLASTQAAAIAQQSRAQNFQSLVKAKEDLEKNVITPYIIAKTGAETLRDVIDAAKSGNNIAGAMQKFETTAATLKAAGFNRINTTELNLPASAGNLLERIEGGVGQVVKGGSKSVPASLQKDMQDYADILEKSAYKKYQTGHKATNDLWGTNIPMMFEPPQGAAPAPVPPALTPGLQGLAAR